MRRCGGRSERTRDGVGRRGLRLRGIRLRRCRRARQCGRGRGGDAPAVVVGQVGERLPGGQGEALVPPVHQPGELPDGAGPDTGERAGERVLQVGRQL